MRSRPISDPDELRENTLDIALDFLACGLDPSQNGVLPAKRRAAGDGVDMDFVNVTPVPMLENAHATRTRSPKG